MSSRARSNIHRSVPVGANRAMSPGRHGTNSLFSGTVNVPMSLLQSWATACASSSRHSCTLSSEPSVPTGIRPMENLALPLHVTVETNASHPTCLQRSNKALIDEIEDRSPRTEVICDWKDVLGPLSLNCILRLFVGPDIRTAKPVNRLFWVSDQEQLPRPKLLFVPSALSAPSSPHNQEQDLGLQRVRVLKFID